MKGISRLFDIVEYQLLKDKKKIAFVSKYNGVWKNTSVAELYDYANNLSKALLEIGVKQNDKIAILTDRNITEWQIIDLALLQIGVQSVPLYASTSEKEMAYILNHASVTMCFVTEPLYNKIFRVKGAVPSLKKIVFFEDSDRGKSIYDYIAEGEKLYNQGEVEMIKAKILGSDVATLIYTSGTTGMPKGIMITHENLISGASNAISTVPSEIRLDRTLSILPISHIFERLMVYMYQYRGTTVFFAESIMTVADDMKIVRPDIMAIVPRLLEKILEKILEKRDTLSGIKKFIFNWALDLGYKYQPDAKNGKKYERKLARARKLVFTKWQDIFGGDLKMVICGGSKLRLEISTIFNAAGITILEGYGLSESSGVGSANSVIPYRNKLGTVGKMQEDMQVRIASDGEILLKGPMIMKGYYKDYLKTKEAFTKDGYFKTGDLGSLDKEGFLKITGRKKEIFKTSGGKYIAPTKIENLLRISKFIEHAIVVGENERFPAAIIQLNFEYFRTKFPNNTDRQLAKHPEVIEIIEAAVDEANESLGQWEKIKKFELTPESWTTADEHLTPTMKVKRDIVRTKYYYLYSKIYR